MKEWFQLQVTLRPQRQWAMSGVIFDCHNLRGDWYFSKLVGRAQGCGYKSYNEEAALLPQTRPYQTQTSLLRLRNSGIRGRQTVASGQNPAH